jgi:hypothetical protein
MGEDNKNGMYEVVKMKHYAYITMQCNKKKAQECSRKRLTEYSK